MTGRGFRPNEEIIFEFQFLAGICDWREGDCYFGKIVQAYRVFHIDMECPERDPTMLESSEMLRDKAVVVNTIQLNSGYLWTRQQVKIGHLQHVTQSVSSQARLRSMGEGLSGMACNGALQSDKTSQNESGGESEGTKRAIAKHRTRTARKYELSEKGSGGRLAFVSWKWLTMIKFRFGIGNRFVYLVIHQVACNMKWSLQGHDITLITKIDNAWAILHDFLLLKLRPFPQVQEQWFNLSDT